MKVREDLFADLFFISDICIITVFVSNIVLRGQLCRCIIKSVLIGEKYILIAGKCMFNFRKDIA